MRIKNLEKAAGDVRAAESGTRSRGARGDAGTKWLNDQGGSSGGDDDDDESDDSDFKDAGQWNPRTILTLPHDSDDAVARTTLHSHSTPMA